ncbi:hypothetical protein [Primorskyibacter sp. S87]|uniref:hypothetical protein n=1 Tax=Primorskyibacter sp. S87 TaxID=3415126 RepID=UPI003C7D0C65
MTTTSPRITTSRVVTELRITVAGLPVSLFSKCSDQPGRIDPPRISQADAWVINPVSVANTNKAVAPPETGVRK